MAWLLAILGRGRTIAACPSGIRALAAAVAGVLGEEERAALTARTGALIAGGAPETLAARIALLPVLASAVDVVRIASVAGGEVVPVAALYFRLGERFGLEWLRAGAARISSDDHWQRQAVSAVIDDLFAHQSLMTERVLIEEAPDPAARIDRWCGGRRVAVERLERLLTELRAAPSLDLSRLAVANRQVRALIGA